MSGVTLHLLRHGAPVRPGLMLGHRDDPPTPAGVAACLARAEGLAVERVLSSDLSRARVPGEAIAQALAVPFALDPRWRELDFGDWDGLAAGGVPEDALARFWNDPDRHHPPAGEPWSRLVIRVRAALEDVPAPTLVVTHAGAMRAALAVLTGLDHRATWVLDLPYASLLTLRFWREPSLSAQVTGLSTKALA